MIVKDIHDPNVTAFNVHSIRFSARFNITVAYEINFSDDKYKSQSTTIIEEPHVDFMKCLIDMEFMAKSMIELPIVNQDGEECMLNIMAINFLKSNKHGIGVKFKLAVEGLSNSKDPIIMYSPSFFEIPRTIKRMILMKNHIHCRSWMK